MGAERKLLPEELTKILEEEDRMYAEDCPLCGGDTEVYDIRYVSYRGQKLRRRRCLSCGHRYGTIEIRVD